MRKLNPFADRVFVKKLFSLTGPMVLQYLMLALVGVSDALMLGSVAQNSMSAVSLATQVQFIQNVILGSLTSAVSVLAAQYWGKQDGRTVQQVLAIGLRVCGGVSLLFCVGCVACPELLMRVFTN